jgi:hypothetical protein
MKKDITAGKTGYTTEKLQILEVHDWQKYEYVLGGIL